jgi:hypothetical protein
MNVHLVLTAGERPAAFTAKFLDDLGAELDLTGYTGSLDWIRQADGEGATIAGTVDDTEATVTVEPSADMLDTVGTVELVIWAIGPEGTPKYASDSWRVVIVNPTGVTEPPPAP